MPSRNSSAARASSSSIFDSAKPTWISTQSPGWTCSSVEQADVDHPPHPADVDPGQVRPVGQDLDDLARGCRGTCARLPLHAPHPARACRAGSSTVPPAGADRRASTGRRSGPCPAASQAPAGLAAAAEHEHPPGIVAEQLDQAQHDVGLHAVRVEQPARAPSRRRRSSSSTTVTVPGTRAARCASTRSSGRSRRQPGRRPGACRGCRSRPPAPRPAARVAASRRTTSTPNPSSPRKTLPTPATSDLHVDSRWLDLVGGEVEVAAVRGVQIGDPGRRRA